MNPHVEYFRHTTIHLPKHPLTHTRTHTRTRTRKHTRTRTRTPIQCMAYTHTHTHLHTHTHPHSHTHPHPHSVRTSIRAVRRTPIRTCTFTHTRTQLLVKTETNSVRFVSMKLPRFVTVCITTTPRHRLHHHHPASRTSIKTIARLDTNIIYPLPVVGKPVLLLPSTTIPTTEAKL